MTADSRRCRWGFHAWRFVSMSNLRRIEASFAWDVGSGWVCTRIDRCQRCRLKRTRYATPLPTSHVRTYQEPSR